MLPGRPQCLLPPGSAAAAMCILTQGWILGRHLKLKKVFCSLAFSNPLHSRVWRYPEFFPVPILFPGPIFSGTGTGTFFPVPVPVLFPGPNFSGTGTGISHSVSHSLIQRQCLHSLFPIENSRTFLAQFDLVKLTMLTLWNQFENRTSTAHQILQHLILRHMPYGTELAFVTIF